MICTCVHGTLYIWLKVHTCIHNSYHIWFLICIYMFDVLAYNMVRVYIYIYMCTWNMAYMIIGMYMRCMAPSIWSVTCMHTLCTAHIIGNGIWMCNAWLPCQILCICMYTYTAGIARDRRYIFICIYIYIYTCILYSLYRVQNWLAHPLGPELSKNTILMLSPLQQANHTSYRWHPSGSESERISRGSKYWAREVRLNFWLGMIRKPALDQASRTQKTLILTSFWSFWVIMIANMAFWDCNSLRRPPSSTQK